MNSVASGSWSNALDHEPEATEFMASLDEKFFDTRLRAWRVRSAIRQSDWRAVINAVAKLEQEERQKPRWRYWRARALASNANEASAVLPAPVWPRH